MDTDDSCSSPLKHGSIPQSVFDSFHDVATEEQRSCTLPVPPYMRQENRYGGEKRML